MRDLSRTEDRLGAFERLAFPEMGGLFNFALHLTRNRADAEDLTQETFLRAFASFDRFRMGTNFRAWIFRILRNATLNHAKKLRVRGTEVDFESVEPVLAAARHHPSRWRWPVTREELRRGVSRLPEAYRTALLLFFVEGFAYAEIAVIMGTPVGTVMSRIYRARRRLRRELLAGDRRTAPAAA
jgi:RNA polymerase sigma-70 factor (ECF subfamily)